MSVFHSAACNNKNFCLIFCKFYNWITNFAFWMGYRYEFFLLHGPPCVTIISRPYTETDCVSEEIPSRKSHFSFAPKMGTKMSANLSYIFRHNFAKNYTWETVDPSLKSEKAAVQHFIPFVWFKGPFKNGLNPLLIWVCHTLNGPSPKVNKS